MADQQIYYQTRTQSQTGKASPSNSHFLVLATLVPFGASLLVIAALILTATVIGLTVATPLFVIFSPVLLPAVLVLGLAVAGFLTSGAFGVTSLSSFAWLAAYLRRTGSSEQKQTGKSPAPVLSEEIGESIANKAQESGQEAQKETKAQETDQKDQKETVPQKTGQETQKESSETGKARKENKTSS